MQGRPSQDSSHHLQSAQDPLRASASSVGKVVAFPGPRPTYGQIRRVLEVLHNTGPVSVRHLRMAADLPEDLLTRCIEHLADADLLTAEDRRDGNALRLIVTATDAGRHLLAADVEGSEAPGESSGQEELA